MEKIKQIAKKEKEPELDVRDLAKTLSRQISINEQKDRYAGAAEVLTFIGAGAFLAASIAIPNLPQVLKPFLNDQSEREAWKRYNLPYLKRTLKRLEKRQLISIKDKDGRQEIKLTKAGQTQVLRFSLNSLVIKKPRMWDGTWYLVTYDIPKVLDDTRKVLREYLTAWGFYPLQESTFLQAYPCTREVNYLREYLNVGDLVRIFKVSAIENDATFREFFGV